MIWPHFQPPICAECKGTGRVTLAIHVEPCSRGCSPVVPTYRVGDFVHSAFWKKPRRITDISTTTGNLRIENEDGEASWTEPAHVRRFE